ncbi:MAG: extracellular solute-binding protein [Spirochaetota bacterium]
MKRLFLVFLICLSALPVFAGGSKESGAQKEVSLRFLAFQVGVHPESAWFEKTVTNFNKESTGKIKVVIDGVAEDQIAWEKLRTEAATDTMPDLFMLKHDRSEFNVMAQSGRVVDLNPYIEADPTLKATLNDPISLRAYRDENGRQLGLPYAKANVGIYYNTELFRKAGINTFPETWDDFFAVCDKLKAAGITPISLMTGDNAWTSMLMLAHFIGTSPNGEEWLSGKAAGQKFEVPVFVNAAARLQKILKEYTTPDAIGANYPISANNFLQSKCAMIANGPWMIGAFSDPKSAPEGFEPKVKYALAPGSGVIAMENVSYASGSKTKEKKDASVEVLKYFTREDVYAEYLNIGGAAPCFKIDMSKINYPRINKEFLPLALKAQHKYTIVPNVVKPAIIDSMAQILPELAAGRITPRSRIWPPFYEHSRHRHEGNDTGSSHSGLNECLLCFTGCLFQLLEIDSYHARRY